MLRGIKKRITIVRGQNNDFYTLIYASTASERDKIIEWYSPLNFFRRQEEIFRSRQPGTGGWLLESNEIKEWQSGTGKTLWCRGIRELILVFGWSSLIDI
jgi:hypothetical protein